MRHTEARCDVVVVGAGLGGAATQDHPDPIGTLEARR